MSTAADDVLRPVRRRVSRFAVPDLGIGVGYRVPHYSLVVEQKPVVDWFELLSENFMVDGGSPRVHLEQMIDLYPVAPHGVSLSLGGEEDPDHTRRLMTFVERVNAPWFSDHLCWTGTREHRVHDLVPVPYTRKMRDHIVDRIKALQDRSGRVFAVENVSAYLAYVDSELSEQDFLAEVVERADCGLLLDVNNVFVSSCNLGFDPERWLDGIPMDRVVQIHLAGHSIYEKYRLDTHDHPVCDEVWALYRSVIRRAGPVSTLVEWDDQLPTFARLMEEAELARAHRDAVLAERDAAEAAP